jgi:hypothetical protein
MPRVTQGGGWLLPGLNRVIDRAGWQCQGDDPEEPQGRCRLLATHTHRRQVGDRVTVAALCPRHYELAGPETPAR